MKSTATKKAQIFISIRCHSSIFQGPRKLLQETWDVFRQLLCWLCRNLWRLSVCNFSRMQTCVQTMPGWSPSCQKICNLHCK
eukprot:CCRYP_019404-RB/>CCRYP_019404-RB protein AED:0.21 eAED:0.71 QI:0/0/0/1/0/0/2/0/81